MNPARCLRCAWEAYARFKRHLYGDPLLYERLTEEEEERFMMRQFPQR